MIVLDTHAWIWYANKSNKLSKRAKEKIEHSNRIGVAAISCWEVAMLVSKERLAFKMDVEKWVKKALKLPKIELIELLPEISVFSTRLPGKFHGDPADRIIVATSLISNAELVSKDQRILDYTFVETIW